MRLALPGWIDTSENRFSLTTALNCRSTVFMCRDD
jgi:hypothetical protein